MKSLTAFLILTLILVLMFSQISHAGIHFKQKSHTGAINFMGQSKPAEDVVEEIWITEDGYRTDDPENSMIMLFKEKKMITIDHKEKTYTEMPMDFDQYSEQMMGDVDQEQLKEFQGMMKGMMKTEITVEVTNEKQKINKWDCKKYILRIKTMMGVITQEIWATEDLKIDPKLYSKFYGSMMSSMPNMKSSMPSVMKELEKIKGVFVKTSLEQQIMNQKVESTTELISFEEKSAPKDLFKIPEGYKKKAFR